MKFRVSICVSAITICAVLVIPSPARAQQEPGQSKLVPHYKLTVLPTLGGTFGEAWGVDNGGSVTGHSTLPGDTAVHAFLWRKGVMTDLGTLGGPVSLTSGSSPLNAVGTVSGNSNTSTPDPNGEDVCGIGTFLICLPFMWQKGVMTALPLLGGNNGIAGGINNRGQIVGISETPNSDPCSFLFLQIEAAIWDGGTVQELPPFPGDSDGGAAAINDAGQAVGATGCVISNTNRAVLWPSGPNGGVVDLGNLGGTGGNVAFDINNRGQVVGQSDLVGDTTHHAFLWQNGSMADLGTLPGVPGSLANGINNKGQVVGFSDDFNGNNVALLWQNGVMTDMNNVVPPSPLFLLEALDINDRGEIVGFGQLSDGKHRGFLLIPCDDAHPGIEGCDYSLVDVSGLPSAASTLRDVLTHVPADAPRRRNNPFHALAFSLRD
jgi:probable HAF family extracellular repeat protein